MLRCRKAEYRWLPTLASHPLCWLECWRPTPPPPTPALPRPAVLFFGNKLTTQTQIGTAVALIGTWLYTEASKKKPAPKAA